MNRSGRWAAALGAGALAVASWSVVSTTSASAAPASASSTASELAVRWSGTASKALRGRGSDGHGGEHGGGGRSDGDRGSKSKHAKSGKAKGKGRGHGHGHGGGQGGGNGGGNGGGEGGGHGCHYPPSKTHQVVLSGPNHTHRGRTVTLNGKVSHNGCSVGGVKVGLYSSHDGKTDWRLIQSAEVDSKGNYTFTVPSHRLHYYQSVAAAGRGEAPVASAILPLPLR